MVDPAHDAWRQPGLNEPAPEFRASSTMGEVALEDYAGRWLVFFSHPADVTPVCTTEIAEFTRRFEDFQREECDLLGLSTDSLEAHRAWLADIESVAGSPVPFPLIADPERVVARTYGMIQPGESDTSAVRTVFVIDPDGRVRASLAYPIPTGRNVEEILRLVRALRTTAIHRVATPENWAPGDDVLEPPPANAEDRARLASEDGALWYMRKRRLDD